MNKLIRVRILGREYPLRVPEEDEADMRAVAGGVDARMQNFKRAYPNQTEIVGAVMTALALADELHAARRVPGALAMELEDELRDLDRTLATALEECAAQG